MLDYQYVEHQIEIVSHDRDYSNAHEQAMLSTKTEERPAEKHADSKRKNDGFTLKT